VHTRIRGGVTRFNQLRVPLSTSTTTRPAAALREVNKQPPMGVQSDEAECRMSCNAQAFRQGHHRVDRDLDNA
jgi:hypothetical protein